MKWTNRIVFCASVLNLSIAHANENVTVYVHPDATQKSNKTVVMFELSEEDLAKQVLVGEDGQLYVKVEKIISLPKDALPYIHETYYGEDAYLKAIWEYWRCSKGHLNPPWSVKCGVESCGESRYH